MFGKVEVRRKSYSVHGVDSIFPQDAQLNLSADQYSDGLRRQTAFAVSEQSFDKASESLSRHTATTVAKRQVENLSRHLSQDFDAFYKSRQTEDSGTSDLLALTCDGKGVVMRQADLRSATQQAAKSSTHKKQTRLSRGEKRTRKRMATVDSVYDIKPHIRSADSIIGSKKEKSQTPRPANKRVWASVEKSPREVIEQMFAEARRRDPKQRRKWVALVDGHPTQLKLLRGVMRKQKIKATIVLDFIHVLEYLWKAAYCFFDEGSQEAEDWVKERALKVLNGEPVRWPLESDAVVQKRHLSAKEREKADKCSDYLLKYKGYVQYDKYLAEGYPIATGVIEGACRYLIKDRIILTLAREITRKQMGVLEGVGRSFDMRVDFGNSNALSEFLYIDDLPAKTLELDGQKRNFKIVVHQVDTVRKEMQIQLLIRNHKNVDIEKDEYKGADGMMVANDEVGMVVPNDFKFWIGYFDFPMIDHTRLSNDQRCAIVLNTLNDASAELTLVYFPGSYASIREKPYFEELVQMLLVDNSLE